MRLGAEDEKVLGGIARAYMFYVLVGAKVMVKQDYKYLPRLPPSVGAMSLV